MNDEAYEQLLQQKANEISDRLAALDFQCTYKVIDYGINFTLYLAGRTAMITLYHSPKKGKWTFRSADEWANTEIKPKIEFWLDRKPATEQGSLAQLTVNTRLVKHVEASDYFIGVLECFHILQVFAEEYIDFSIICEQAKISITHLLDDTRYTHLDKPALRTILTIPPSSDFITAKEYLSQCLRLCQIPINL